MFFSNPALTANGEVGCQHSRCNRSYWRQSNAVSATPATQAWVVIGGRYDNGNRRTTGTVVTLCSRHSATVRSLITRGTRGYSERTYRSLAGVATVAVAAANREAIGQAAADGYDRETREAAEARRRYVMDNRAAVREAHLATVATTYRPVSISEPDEYGRVFVNLDYRNISPGQAEALAAALLTAAATARSRMEADNNA